MTRIFRLASFGALLSRVPAALMMALLLGAPLYALSNVAERHAGVIEAPSPAKKGVGFVLLVTLQRT